MLPDTGASQLQVYESGTNKGSFGAFGPDDVLEIQLTTDNTVQYVKNGQVFYTSTVPISWPLHVGAAINAVQDVAFDRIQYLDSLPPGPPGLASPPPSPPTSISPPPPLPPGDYVVFDGGASTDLVVGPGQVARVRGSAGWNAAAWSRQDLWSADGPRKGISFQCPISSGAKMIGFVTGSFATSSSYTAIKYAIYCARLTPFHRFALCLTYVCAPIAPSCSILRLMRCGFFWHRWRHKGSCV